MRLIEYCKINGFGKVNKRCVESAFHSKDEKVVAQAKRYKLQNLTKEE